MSKITAKDISEYLETQDDFDLELFVHRELLEHGIGSSHGGTYVDPHLKKARQFDIRASTFFRELGWQLNLAIECKSLSTAFPLIVSRVPRPESEARHYLIRSWEGGGLRRRVEIWNSTGSHLPLYREGRPVGKHTFQLRRDDPQNSNFKTGDSDSYDKWSQALASAADLIITWSCGAHLRYGVPQIFSAVLPLLVVSDDTLWVVDYDDSGKRLREPKRVEECELFVDREYEIPDFGKYPVTHLHIYTRKGFLAFLTNIRTPNSMLLERIFGSTVNVQGGQ